jgi:hypothetical protein
MDAKLRRRSRRVEWGGFLIRKSLLLAPHLHLSAFIPRVFCLTSSNCPFIPQFLYPSCNMSKRRRQYHLRKARREVASPSPDPPPEPPSTPPPEPAEPARTPQRLRLSLRAPDPPQRALHSSPPTSRDHSLTQNQNQTVRSKALKIGGQRLTSLS